MSAKIVLTGESTVGKTSIAHYLVKGYSAGQTESTIGAAFMTLKLANGRYEVWDTAGQERYYSLMPMYYRKSNIIFLVYDMTSWVSFDNLERNVIPNVLECIPEHERPNVHLVVIENKIDLEEYRTVPPEKGPLLADLLKEKVPHTNFFRTSAVTGEGINGVLTYLLMSYHSFQIDQPSEKKDKYVDLDSFVYENETLFEKFWKGWCTLI